MKVTRSLVLFLFLSFGMIAGCDVFSNDESGPVTLTGQVVDNVTQDPILEAFVQINPMDVLVETDDRGRYTAEVEIDSTMEINLVVSKSGYQNGNSSVLAVANRTIEVATIGLTPSQGQNTGGGNSESGSAANILLKEQTTSIIGVRESGSLEVAELVFQVTDSIGRPVSLDNETTVNFSFGAFPGGDASIAPATAQTNASGEVKTAVSSGTVAGVIQVVATASVNGVTIRSKPVALSIHGGLPDLTHFTLGPPIDGRNIAHGWDFFNIATDMTALVGDKYSNPVRPGTSVYFKTTGGVIQGSAVTNDLGSATVTLLTGNPRPVHPQYGNGYAIVTATTVNEDNTNISTESLVLFSGTAIIFVPESQGALQIGKTIRYFVFDQNQNPLGSGTSITVRASGENVAAFGNTDVELTDHIFGGPGITEFSFGIQSAGQTDADGNPLPSIIEAATIKVSSPNGRDERVVLANGGILKRDESGKLIPVP